MKRVNFSLSSSAKSTLRIVVCAFALSLLIWAALLAAGVMRLPEDRVSDEISHGLELSIESLSLFTDELAARAVALSDRLSRVTARENSTRSFEDLTDDPSALSDIQRASFQTLLSAMNSAQCSGAFFFLFTTMNSSNVSMTTGKPNTANGIYIKFRSSESSSIINSETALFRGDNAVAVENGVYLDGAWELEDDGEFMAALREAAYAGGDVPPLSPKPYFLTSSVVIRNEWEHARLLGAPVTDYLSGRVIGVCGFEINDLCFRHYFPSVSSLSFALLDEWNDDMKDGRSAVSLEREISIGAGAFARRFVAASGISQERGKYLAASSAAITVLFLLAISAMLSCAFILTRRYAVSGIRRSIRDVISGFPNAPDAPASGDIPEIDDLWEFLSSLDQERAASEEMHSAYASQRDDGTAAADAVGEAVFEERLSALTKREREIFDMYLSGMKGTEIAAALCISVSTMKYHNKNIYTKLGVSSRREMMAMVNEKPCSAE